MGIGEPEAEGIDEQNIGTERSDNSPTRENKPGRRPKPKGTQPDAAELQWDVIRHHFPDWLKWLKDIRDPRKRPNSCTFPIEFILITALMMFCGQCGSRRQLGRELNEGKRFGGNIWRMIGKTYSTIVCHPDTMNNVLTLLDPEELEKLITQISNKLRRSRVLDKFRFNGKLIVAVDGTQILKFNKPHCDHCTFKKTTNGIIYSHYVLIAKIVTSIGLVIPFAFEFVENPGEEFDKQDCELKAFRRLVEKIKRLYPRMPIALTGDALYAEETTLSLGELHGWDIIITLKEKKLPTVTAQLPPDHGDWTKTKTIDVFEKGKKIKRYLRWKTAVRYHSKIFHVVEMEDMDEKGERIYYNRWITTVIPRNDNIEDLAQFGRLRWKIENEGINTQKTGGYEMEHGYGLKGNAWKNYFLILQISQLLNDLVRFGDYIKKATGDPNATFANVFETMHNFAAKLIECMRNNTPEFHKPYSCFQIRLGSP